MNLYNRIIYDKNKEISETLFENRKILVERILSSGQISDIYDQEEDEWVILLEGESIIEMEGKEIKLKKGDHLYIEAHKKHKVAYTSENCLWLCVFIK